MAAHTVLAIMVLAGMAVFLQVYRIRFVNNGPNTGDAFTYLRVAREMRKQGTLFPEMVFYYTGQKETLNLPPLLMILLAPVSQWSYGRLIHTSFILDLIIALVLYFFAVSFIPLGPAHGLIAALVYLLTPINTVTSASLTPRSLGLLWFTVFVAAMSVHSIHGGSLSIAIAVLAAALAFLSQRMVAQIIVIVSPFAVATLWLLFDVGHLEILAVIAGGMLLALAITKGRYLPVLKDHMQRIALHARHGQQDRFKREFGNPVQILKANPWLLIAAGFVLLQGIPNELLWVPAAYATGIVLLAVLWVMGNSVNHVYFLSPLVALILAASVPLTVWVEAVLCVIAAICCILIMREFRIVAGRRIKEDWLDCFRYINESRMAGRALALPQIGFPPLIYYTPLVMASSGHGSKAISYDRMTLKKNISNPEYLARFVKENSIRYLIVDHTTFADIRSFCAMRGEITFKEQYRNSSLAIMESQSN